MKIGTITITNFLTIGEAKIDLADRGLCLVEGVNEDDTSANSNGAGKSTIADAVCWALFGTTARGIEGDAVINRTAGKNCWVQVPIIEGSESWQVIRHRKHKTGKNSVQLAHVAADGTVTDLTKGTDKLTQVEIEKVLGCSYDVFKSSIYAGQEAMPDLPGMTDKTLKLLVEEASGVTVLEAAYKEANSRVMAAKGTVHYCESQLSARVTLKSSVEETIDRLSDSRTTFETERRDAIEGNKMAARELAEEARKVAGEIAGKREPIEEDIRGCDAKLAAVEAEKTELNRLVGLYNDATRAEARAKLSFDSKMGEARRQQTVVTEIEGQIGKPCGECGKEYCEHDIEEARRIAKAKFVTLATEAQKLKSAMEDAQKASASTLSALETHRASMTDVSSVVAQRASLTTALNDVQRSERDRDDLIRRAREHLALAERKKVEPNPFIAAIEREEKKLGGVNDEILKIEADLEKAQTNLEVAELVAKTFSPTGVRGQILDEVTPYLNDQTAKYLGTLSDGNIRATWTTLVKTAKGELREKFAIEVSNDTGGDSFASISGGEKKKVRVAAALALQDLVSTRATKPIELFIGDEIDSALDAAGLERLMTILEEKARERGSVFVISHADLKAWIPQVLTVTKKEGVSTVAEAVT